MKPITPQPLSWIDEAPLTVRATRRIHAPVEAVWARIADHESWPEWFDSLGAVEPGDPPTGVGGHRTVSVGPVRIGEEFLAWEENRRFAFCVTHMKPRTAWSLVEDVQLEPIGDDATTITYTQGWDPLGGRPVMALMRRTLPGQLEKALGELARLVGG